MICISYTYGENYSPLADICIPSLVRYCKKNNYHWGINMVKPDEKTGYDYLRINRALSLLKQYEIIFIMEGDFLITNHTKRIENFIDDKHSFFICKDVNGVNGGSFIVIQNNFSDNFLKSTNELSNSYKTEQNVWESTELIHLKEVKILPHPSINSIPYKYYHNYGYINYQGQSEPTHEMGNWQKGDFVCHLPGKTLEERIKIFTEIKEQIIYE